MKALHQALGSAALVAALLAAGPALAAQLRDVGPDETAVEVAVTGDDPEVTFRIARHCYGSNRPTAASRLVIALFETARRGFARDAAGGSVWVGGQLADLRQAAALASPLLAVPVRSIDSPRDIARAATLERGRAGNDPLSLFPVPAGEAGLTAFTLAAPPDPGDRRTVAVSGCYTPAQLSELLRRRAGAAGAFLDAMAEGTK